MKGKGLESLIPKKIQNENREVPGETTQETPHEFQHTKESSPAIGKSYPISYSYDARAMHREPLIYENKNAPTEEALQQVPRGSHGLPHYPPAHIKRDPLQGESIFQIEVDKIKPNPYQPRREFNGELLEELAQSIRDFGILQPLVVSKVTKETAMGTDVEYQLIAGERRLMAAKQAGLPRVPVIIKKIDAPRSKLELALVENIQRSNLNPLESARGYARLQDEFGLTQREIAVRVGKSREAVANALRLLNLSPEIQSALAEGKISESQARMLLGVADKKTQEHLFHGLLEKKTTVRDLQEKVSPQHDPQKNYWETQLEEKLGTPVKVIKQGKRGKVVIQFYSEEEWQGILDRLLGEDRG